MNRQFRELYITLLVSTIFLGCASPVEPIRPARDGAYLNPLQIEVKFHSRADISTFQCDLDGTSITNTFTISGNRATATAPTLYRGLHTLNIRADMSPSRSGDVTGRSIPFAIVPNPAPVYIRNWSQYDINQVWLVRGGGPGVPLVRNLITQDLSTLVPAGRSYNNEILLDIPLRHDPSIDPTPTPYYVLEYIQEKLFFNGQPIYYVNPRSSTGFAPGTIHVPGYSLVRETIFLFDWNSVPSSRFEQMLRGPDSKLYLYRPGMFFVGHPEVDHGPILLQTLIDEGYGAYNLSQRGL